MYFMFIPRAWMSLSTVYSFIINYLLTKSQVFTGKSSTKTLAHCPSVSEVNIARLMFEIFP